MCLECLVHCWRIALTKFAVGQKVFGFLAYRNVRFYLYVWQLCEDLVVCLSAIFIEGKLQLVELSLISEFRTKTPLSYSLASGGRIIDEICHG